MIPDRLPLDQEAIQKIIPHRPPFLMIDRVVEASAEQVVATRELTGNEFFFQGHFPGNPLMPGVLLVEAMAQTCLILQRYNFDVEDLFFLAREKSRFYHPVRPGDSLRIVARKVKLLREMGMATAEVFVGDKKVAESDLSFASAKARENPIIPR